MEKVIRDGRVAVLISPGYGAGWSTWNTQHPGILFDPEIVNAILADNKEQAQTIAKTKYPGGYFGGIEDLQVEWVDVGQAFKVDEYDGFESISFNNDDSWTIA